MSTLTEARRAYRLDEQVGFVLRQVSQRHTAIFAAAMPDDLTPTQWAAMAKLAELGPCSQNRLGRKTAMDVATIKGVVDRLTRRGLTAGSPDPSDGRRLLIALTDEGRALYERAQPLAQQVTSDTLEPLSADERRLFLRMLNKLV